KPGVVDALGVDDAETEVSEMIVVGGGDGELHARHSSRLQTLLLGLAVQQPVTLDGERVRTQSPLPALPDAPLKAHPTNNIVMRRRRSRPIGGALDPSGGGVP